jgi:hypothetical protein
MKRLIAFLSFLALLTGGLAQSASAGTFEAMSTSGILDVDGVTYLQGNVMELSGDLVQLIWTGPDGVIDAPDSLGRTTDDDSLLGTTFIGYGYPFEPDAGKFSIIWTHDLLAPGNIVYIRAWNDSVVVPGQRIDYGNSALYTLATSFDSHDFRTFQMTEAMSTPVELASFEARALPGVIELRWATHSETNNLGFNLLRSTSPHGEKVQINEKLIEGAMNSQIRHDYAYSDRDIDDKAVYYYWLTDIALDGQVTFNGPRTAVAVAKPAEYLLAQNYPNPFNPSTSISYTLKDNGMVKLAVYNIRGQLIRSLVNHTQMAGQYNQEWDGRDDNGIIVPTGTYIYTLEINGFKAVRRMTMAK